MSGLTPADVQFSEVHDCFSIAELVHIEDLGFFRRARASRQSARAPPRERPEADQYLGRPQVQGAPVGATGVGQLFEVWKQLGGEAGQDRVPNNNLHIGAAHNLGGCGGTCTFTILERR